MVESQRGAINSKAKVSNCIDTRVVHLYSGFDKSNCKVLTDHQAFNPNTGSTGLKSLARPLRNKDKQKTLADIDVGEKARILELQCEGAYRRRLLDLGLIPGTKVRAVMKSPLGNPMAYEIRRSIIALRLGDASNIIVKQENEKENVKGAD